MHMHFGNFTYFSENSASNAIRAASCSARFLLLPIPLPQLSLLLQQR